MRLVLKVRTVLSFACKAVAVAVAFLILGAVAAEARPRHAHAHAARTKQAAEECFFLCAQPEVGPTHKAGKRAAVAQTEQSGFVQSQSSAAEATSHASKDTVVGGRPAGCPHRWCGCQASIEIFGKIIPYLNLASNWLRAFPHVSRSAGAPGMAAARPGHVVVLMQHKEGNRWVIKDGNYAGATHVREADISSYTIVDPRGGKLAMN